VLVLPGDRYTGWAKKVIPLVHYITLYKSYHFFGPPCIEEKQTQLEYKNL